MTDVLKAVNSLLTPELINDIALPDDLLDARTEKEVQDRHHYLYHAILSPIGLKVAGLLGKPYLSVNEIGVVSERIQAYLKQNGF